MIRITINIRKNITKINHTIYKNRKIDFIVIHYFGAFGTAEANTRYFKDVNRSASAHYFVDEKDTWQVVEDENAAWHCGDVGQGEYKGVCRNANSIGVEMRPDKINRKSTNSSDRDWYFKENTVERTIQLVRHLMKKHNVPIDKVIRHYDVTNKYCPRPFVGNDINTYYNKTGNQLWVEFRKRLIEEEEGEMDGKQIFEELSKYLNSLPTSNYAEESSKKGVASGLFVDGDKDGLVDNPKGILTREQLAVDLDRAGMFEKTKKNL